MIISFEDIEKKLEDYCKTDVELTQHLYKHSTQLELGYIRLVSPKRKRKLWKKRGVVCNWSNELNSYYWFSEEMGNPKKNDIHRNSIKLKLSSVYGRAGNV